MFRLIPADGPRRVANLDIGGAVLVTGGMLLLIYTVVQAPTVGWGETRTIAGFAGAGAILALFAAYELRQSDPLFPFSILRIKGLAAADVTQIVAMAGFYSMFFFITLYMQNVLNFSKIGAGAAYLPATFGVAIGAGIATQLLGKRGTRPVIVGGAVLGAAGIFWISRIPVHGSYLANLLPPLVVMALGLGAVFVGVTTAAQAGVPADKAGLAAALINSSTWLGGALGVAIFSAISTSRARDLLADHATPAEALTSGFQRARLAAAIFLAAAAVIALRAPNTRGEQEEAAMAPAGDPVGETA
jgi:predicted MFS family arabinose efflux permease